MKNKTIQFFLISVLLVAVLIGLGVAGYYIYQDSKMDPEKVLVTNLTDTGASYTWYTEDKTIGRIKVKEVDGSWLDGDFYDDRDMEQDTVTGEYVLKEGGAQERYTHHVSVRGLEPEKEYEVVVAGTLLNIDTDKDGNELPKIETTTLNEDIKTPDPAYGAVAGLPDNDDTLVIAELVATDDTELEERYVSTTTNDEGSYSFDMNYLTKGVDRENFIVRYEVEVNLLLEGEQENYFTRRLPTIELKPLPKISYETDLVGQVGGELDNSLYSPVVARDEEVCDDGIAVGEGGFGCSASVGEKWNGRSGSGHCNICEQLGDGSWGKRHSCGRCVTPVDPNYPANEIDKEWIDHINKNVDEGEGIGYAGHGGITDVSENYATYSDYFNYQTYFNTKAANLQPSDCSRTQSASGAYHTYCACGGEDGAGGHCVATDYLTDVYGQSCYNFCAGAKNVISTAAEDSGTNENGETSEIDPRVETAVKKLIKNLSPEPYLEGSLNLVKGGGVDYCESSDPNYADIDLGCRSIAEVAFDAGGTLTVTTMMLQKVGGTCTLDKGTLTTATISGGEDWVNFLKESFDVLDYCSKRQNVPGTDLSPGSSRLSGVLGKATAASDKLVTESSGNYVVYYGDNFEQPISEFAVNLDGANRAEIRLFVDTNGNGKKDKDEPVLEDYTSLSLKKESEVATYTLNAGWNLITMPLISSDGISTASELLDHFNNQGADVKHIAKYTDSGFEMYTKRENDQEFSNDYNIVPGQGYFVLNYEPQEVKIKGNKFDEAIPFRVRNGWNLVGVYTNEAPYTAEELLKDMEAEGIEADVVSKYEGGLYTSVVYEDDILYGNDYNIFERAGYFVRVNSGGGSEVKFTPTPEE